MKSAWQKYNIFLFYTGLFLLSRFLYSKTDLFFDTELLTKGWQYLDVELLKNDLPRSIFYLHAQPPLMNLFLGLVLQLPENWQTETFHIVYLLAGLGMLCMLVDSMRKLQISHIITFVIAVIFMASPAIIMYENWLFYSYFEAFFLMMMLWAAVNYLKKEENTKYLIFFFSALALLCLARSMFHILFFVAIAIFLIYISKNKKQVVYTSAVPFLVVFAWYAKNLFLIGSFTASSWFGMNLAKMSYNWSTPLGQTGNWESPEKYDSLYHFSSDLNGHPAMENWHKQNGECNYNFKGYIQISNDFKKDAIDELKRHPENYWKNVKLGSQIFFEPVEQIRYGFMETNERNLHGMRKIYNAGMDYKVWHIGNDLIGFNALLYTIVIIAALVLLYFYRNNYIKNIILFILFIFVYIFIVGNLLELFENNRFRFATIPLFLFLGALECQFFYQLLRKTPDQ